MLRGSSLTIRLSDEERVALDDAARREDLPASIIIRGAIRNELERLQKAWEAKQNMGSQSFYFTADGKKYHMEFEGPGKGVLVSGPWPKSPIRGVGVVPVKHYAAASLEEARRVVAEQYGRGEFR